MTPKPRTLCLTTAEVRGFMDGTRTQIRRIIKPQPGSFAGGVHPKSFAKHPAPYIDAYCGEKKTEANPRGMSAIWCWWCEDDRMGPEIGKCPFGAPGGVIVCKETWCPIPEMKPAGYFTPKWINRTAWYAADNDRPTWAGPWNSSSQMPPEYSRLSLTPTAIRVERVRDVTEVDARAMGHEGGLRPYPDDDPTRPVEPEQEFRETWQKQHPGSWERNDWVWVGDMKVVGK